MKRNVGHVMLNLFQHLMKSADCETLNQVQGDRERRLKSGPRLRKRAWAIFSALGPCLWE
jgi:hypothetical protein